MALLYNLHHLHIQIFPTVQRPSAIQPASVPETPLLASFTSSVNPVRGESVLDFA